MSYARRRDRIAVKMQENRRKLFAYACFPNGDTQKAGPLNYCSLEPPIFSCIGSDYFSRPLYLRIS